MKKFLNSFWSWYGRHYLLTLVITSTLFLLQAFHLYWLFTDVVLRKLTGHSYFVLPPQGIFIYVMIDYIEIPTHISASLIYIYNFRRKFAISDLVFFIFLQLHWLHILWITDDIVLERLSGHTILGWGLITAWIAILLDYLEIPIMLDQLKKVYRSRREILLNIRKTF